MLRRITQQDPPLPPLDVLDEVDLNRYLLTTHSFARVIGNYSRRPLSWELIWVLQPGPDPRPFCDDELARMIGVLDAGGAVFVLGTEQAAIDIAMNTVEAMTAGGHA